MAVYGVGGGNATQGRVMQNPSRPTKAVAEVQSRPIPSKQAVPKATGLKSPATARLRVAETGKGDVIDLMG